MPVPETLSRKIALFRSRGHLVTYAEESFGDASWISMYAGFGIFPQRDDARVDEIPEDVLRRNLALLRELILNVAESAPAHDAFIAWHCAAG